MNKFSRRLAALVVTGALVVAGVTLTASAANAASIAGNIKLFTTGSNVGTIAAKQITSGSSTTNPMLYGLTIDQACPAGFRGAAIFTVWQSNVKVGTLGSTGFLADDGVEGTNGLSPADTSIAMDESSTLPAQNPKVDNNRSLEVAAPTLATGSFELRYYCGADTQGQFDFTTDDYFVLTLNFDKTAHTWGTPVQKLNTTTSITANADQVAKTVAINTTVKLASDGTTATPATGTATVNETAPTASVLGTATVANGVATFTTGSLSPGVVYTFTVTYSGDAAYNGSTSAGSTVGINGSNSSTTNVTFDVLAGANPGGLVLSNVPGSVDLGSATFNGGLLTASNLTDFSGITVTDNRSLDAAAWSLTGSVGDFTSGTKTLSGKYLGWTPAVTSGPATAGAVVLPAAQAAPTGGLLTVSQLATAPVVDGSAVSVVKAGLNIAIPANSATGHYSAVLTLTLA